MSIGFTIRSILSHVFTAHNLTAAEAFVAKVAPAFSTELTAFMATLPSEFASLEKAALQLVDLYKAAKGTTISKSLAIQVAQSIYTANSGAIEAEAVKLLKL